MTSNNKKPRITTGLGNGQVKPIIGANVRSAGNGRVRVESEDRYAGYLPTSMVEKYREGVEDPLLLQLRHEIALLDVRIKGLTETIASEFEAADLNDISRAVREFGFTDPGDVERIARIILEFLPDSYVDRRSWARMRQMVSAYEKALDKLDNGGAERALGALFKAIRLGGSTDVAWDQIVSLMDARRRLVATEIDREMRQKRLMDVDKVLPLLASLVESLQVCVITHVRDVNVQEAIFYDAESAYRKVLSRKFNLSDDPQALAEDE